MNHHQQPAPIPGPARSRAHVVYNDQGDIVEYELGPSEAAWSRAWRCWILAPTLSIYEALVRGDNVPVEQLDPEGVRRLWKRPA